MSQPTSTPISSQLDPSLAPRWWTTTNGSVVLPTSSPVYPSSNPNPTGSNNSASISHSQQSSSVTSNASDLVGQSSPTVLPTTVTLLSTTYVSSFTTFLPPGSSLPLSSVPTASPFPNSNGNGALSGANSSPVCIGDGIDTEAIGLLATIVLSSAIGLLLWLLFAFIRPRFRQLYGMREWFIEPQLRPQPLSNKPWAFLFPHVPFVPSVPKDVDDAGQSLAGDAKLFPADDQLTQRVLWIAFLLCLGWTVLGLAGALPLYLVTTPCLANSSGTAQFGGQLSTLQDLSLMRLLVLLENRNVTISEAAVIKRTTVNGHDFTHNVTVRLIVLTVLVIVIGVLPAAWKLYHEFNRLVAYRQRWLKIKCGSQDMVWLSAAKAPGFSGWGEARLKEFLTKNGLSSMEQPRTSSSTPLSPTSRVHRPIGSRHGSSNSASQDSSTLEIDVQGLFTIGDTSNLTKLIEERDYVLNRLEEAETKYIASFRVTTPDPSIMDIPQSPYENDAMPQISRPKMLSGSSGASRTARGETRASHSVAPTSYVAPSSYYRLGGVRGVNGGSMSSRNKYTFGKAVHDRVVGTRFKEVVNRDSGLYGRLPLGSNVRVGESGDLEPIPDLTEYGPNHGPEVSSSQEEHQHSPLNSNDDRKDISFLRPKPLHQQSASSDRETFAMRDTQEDAATPPHLRTQAHQPFVRPLTGIDHTHLSSVYESIRYWRQHLKSINVALADAQQEGYAEIANGVQVKGWLLYGRGVRFIPGVESIEGRSKSDIRWSQLQVDSGSHQTAMFWITTTFVAILLGATLVAVAGLALSGAPGVGNLLTFLGPLAGKNDIGTALATTLAPAVLATLFVVVAVWIVRYAAKYHGAVSVSGSQLTAFRATFYMLTFVSGLWLIAVGSAIFALRAFDTGQDRAGTVSRGTLYTATFLLIVVVNVAIIAPALLMIQPFRLLKMTRRERRAITPRQRFRALYPKVHDPTVTVGCCILAVVFASAFAVIFPLIGPAIVVLLFLTLIAHRYLVGYVHGRTGIGQNGGILQIWLIKRLGSLLALQPLLLGLVLLANRLWILGGILVGSGLFLLVLAETYTLYRLRQPSEKILNSSTRQSLMMFRHIGHARSGRSEKNAVEKRADADENASLVRSPREVRSRTSMASVLEMMSITLAVMPSSMRSRTPIPLATEDLDDLTATERAARTNPDAPPHLPPLPFADHAEETAGILYAPELLAPPPMIWLPNDTSGVALSEAYDLQRYHDLRAVIDVRSQEDVLSRSRDAPLSRPQTRNSGH